MLSDLLDKAQDTLQRFSHFMGEGSAVAPGSIKKRREAKASVALDLPSLRELLPYESMTDDLFIINKNSIGFGLHALPAAGADETLVKSMAELMKNKLPVGVDCTVMLYKHPHLGGALAQGFDASFKRGGIFRELAAMSLKYHERAAVSGYTNGRNIAAQLADYRVYLFFSTKKNHQAHARMQSLREDVSSELRVSGLAHANLEQADFVVLMKSLVSPNASLNWPEARITQDESLGYSIPVGNSLFAIDELGIDIDTSDKQGVPHKHRVVNCHIEKWPEQFALWQSPDVFASLLHPEHGIPCSFLVSFTIRGASQEKMIAKAKSRAKSLNANANGIQHFLNPGAVEEGAAWNYIHEEGNKGNLSLLPTFYNLMLFTTPDQERDAVAKAIGAYRQLGFELQQSRAIQWVRYLSSLPFFITEGFFQDLSILGLIKHMTHTSVANLLPIVADTKGAPQGMLLPTHRHQLAFLDTFDNKSLPITNFNFLTVGSPGAGKSMFQQAQILSGLAMGEMTYVIDLGDSYKHLCEMVGGTYIDASKITLNPFTLFDFDGKTEVPLGESKDARGIEVDDNIQIRDLLAIMANPHEPISQIQRTFLLDAASTCWKKQGRKACMDDVLEALSQRFKSSQDSRIGDLVTLLHQYGSNGIYGHMFNGETPKFADSPLVVFEMGGLQSNPELLTIVMFVMIVVIQGQFYQTDRRIKKRCIIDEAWRFLCDGSNPIAANFIEQGFRTARKHNGGFGVATQYLEDTDKTIQGQAIAASSDLKIIMRQGNFQNYVSKHPDRFNPFQQRMIESFGDVSGSGFSNLMLEAGNTYSFHRYFADPFTRVLFSSNGQEFGEVEALMKQGISVAQAVYQVAQKYYGGV